ncbi:hypothetical protein [Sphingomonas arenae]|uniref:hypothetical protein n=1 Tax=Sphingomonas arenae TaxID=2812555 RepID=UPI00196829C2|nr:hypothetical protein [Sphingomonas arenae]
MKHTPIVPGNARRGPKFDRVERGLEAVLFGSRWLMAPFYLLMVVALACCW